MGSILAFIALSVLTGLSICNYTVFGIESNQIDELISSLNSDLKPKINNLMSNALNETDNILNSSSIINGSNLTSNNIIISNNQIMSTITKNDSDVSNSMIKDQVRIINGVCTSVKVGGNGNDSLVSVGNCNDELTGGPGADEFMCGKGNDTINDYNPKEGDVILDKQSCETIL
ncbi:MAG TPA: hypothetical protein VJ772_07100 [Nitrososphaeraceae archaeon]|nr:hypothetical protein [Nitrososphaeraceae archaeon]